MARSNTLNRPAKQDLLRNEFVVCIVDDDAGTRTSLQFLLEAKRIPVVTYESATDFLANWIPEQTGCLVVDIRMPDMTGRELQIELKKRGYDVPLILMTGYGSVSLAVETMGRGALHFFEKPVPYQPLLEMIEIGLAKSRDNQVDAAEEKEFRLRYAKLSPQETKVAELVALGLRSQDIAKLLEIVPGTVDLHRGKVYDKMEVRNLAELVRMMVTHRAPLRSADTPTGPADASSISRDPSGEAP